MRKVADDMKEVMRLHARQLAIASAFVFAIAAVAMLAIVGLHGCSASQQQALVRHVIEVAPGECVKVAKIYENGTVEEICANIDELAPLLPLSGVRAAPAGWPEPSASSKAAPARSCP